MNSQSLDDPNSLYQNYDNGDNKRTDPNTALKIADENGRVILDLGDRAKTIVVNENTDHIFILNKLIDLGKPGFKNATEEQQIASGYGIHTAASFGEQKNFENKQIDVSNDEGGLSDEMLKLIEIATQGGAVGSEADINLRLGHQVSDGENSFFEVLVDGRWSTDVIRIEGALALEAIALSAVCANTFVGTPGDDRFFGLPGDTCISGLDGRNTLSGDAQQVFFEPASNQDDGVDAFVNGSFSADAGFVFGNDVIESGDGELSALSGDTFNNAFAGLVNGAEGSGSVTISVTTGDDRVGGGAGADRIYGDAIELKTLHFNTSGEGSDLRITAGNDLLYGAGGSDEIYGDAREALHDVGSRSSIGGTGFVEGGSDTVFGGEGDDQIFGDFFEAISGFGRIRFGDDQLFGGSGADTIIGDAFQAALSADGAQEEFGGDDTLEGGRGNDALWGDFQNVNAAVASVGGADVFVFGFWSGFDVIHDFEDPGAGLAKDLIDVSAYGISSFDQLAIVEVDGDTIIDLDGTPIDIDQVTVLNTTGLGQEDFIFA